MTNLNLYTRGPIVTLIPNRFGCNFQNSVTCNQGRTSSFAEPTWPTGLEGGCCPREGHSWAKTQVVWVPRWIWVQWAQKSRPHLGVLIPVLWEKLEHEFLIFVTWPLGSIKLVDSPWSNRTCSRRSYLGWFSMSGTDMKIGYEQNYKTVRLILVKSEINISLTQVLWRLVHGEFWMSQVDKVVVHLSPVPMQDDKRLIKILTLRYLMQLAPVWWPWP